MEEEKLNTEKIMIIKFNKHGKILLIIINKKDKEFNLFV